MKGYACELCLGKDKAGGCIDPEKKSRFSCYKHWEKFFDEFGIGEFKLGGG